MIKKEVYLGLIAFVYGILILFQKYLAIPLLFNENFVAFIILIFGVIFLYSILRAKGSHKSSITAAAILMIILGLFPLLVNLRLLASLPFLPLLRIPFYSFAIILIAFGLYKIYEFFVNK